MDEFIELYNDSLVITSDNNSINTWIKKLENNELMDEKSNYITLHMIFNLDFTPLSETDSKPFLLQKYFVMS